jgi:Mor family transcriptional regulator
VQKVVKEIADAVGLAGALEVVRRWGGRALYVPANIKPDDPFALAIGLDLASRMVRAFGGRSLQLPAERAALIDQRNAAIERGIEAGRSHESLGVEFGLTRQQVGNIAKQARERKGLAGIPPSAGAGKCAPPVIAAAAAE